MMMIMMIITIIIIIVIIKHIFGQSRRHNDPPIAALCVAYDDYDDCDLNDYNDDDQHSYDDDDHHYCDHTTLLVRAGNPTTLR